MLVPPVPIRKGEQAFERDGRGCERNQPRAFDNRSGCRALHVLKIAGLVVLQQVRRRIGVQAAVEVVISERQTSGRHLDPAPERPAAITKVALVLPHPLTLRRIVR